MTGIELIKMGKYVAKHISAPLSTFDDCVQEAILHILKRKSQDLPKPFIFRQMRQRLLNLCRDEHLRGLVQGDRFLNIMYEGNFSSPKKRFEVEYTEHGYDLAELHVTKREAPMVLAMLHNDLHIRDAAEEVGIPKSTFMDHWKSFKEKSRKSRTEHG